MTTERIDIVVREDGSRVVKRNISDIGNAAEDASSALDLMKNILTGLVAGGVITGLVRMADAYTTIQNKLRLVTTGTENLARVTKELQGIANATRTDFESTAELYSRVSGAAKDLGLSQKQLLTFTKSLNQAVVLSGATAEEAAGGLRQLAQGLASGALRGDELNSVMENFPKVADIIAQGLGKTRGELRALGAAGKITADDIINAFAKAEKSLDQDFAKTVPTVSQSLTVLRNNFMIWVGEMDKSLGITQGLAKAILFLSENMDTLLPILSAVGVAIATAFAPGIIAQFASQIRGLWAIMMANPFVAIAAAIAGVLSYLYLMRDEIKLGIDDTTTLGDLMRAVWESIGPAIKTVADLAAQFFGWLTNTSSGTFDQMLNDLVGYQHQNESTWLKILRVVVQVFDMIGGTIRGVMAGVNAVITQFIDAWINNFKQLGKVVSALADGDIEGIKAAIKSNLDGYKKAATTAGDAFSKAFQQEVLSQSESGLESMLDGWIKRAQEIGKDRVANKPGTTGALAAAGPRTIKPPVDSDAMKNAAKELDRLKNALANVMDAADPLGAAQRRLAEAQDILSKSVKAGLIDQKKASEVYKNLAGLMEDQLDPLGAVNRELDKSISLLKMNNEQRQVEADLMQFTEQLRRDGVKMTQEEVATLRAKLVVEQELAKIAQARDAIENESAARQLENAKTTITAMNEIKNLTSGDKFNVLNNLLGGNLEGTAAEFDARIEQFKNYYAIIEQFRQQDVANEQLASDAKRAIKQQEMDLYLQRTSDALGAAAGLMKSNSKEAFRIGQAAAIGQAIVNTYTGAVAAYQSAANIPYVGWILAPIAAAGAVAAGMAQVNAIRSQQMPAYRTGGSYTVGGTGGVDSQTVAMRATPGEKINVNTPAQARALEKAGQGGGEGGGRNIRIINVSSEQEARNFATSEENEEIILNVLQKNGLF